MPRYAVLDMRPTPEVFPTKGALQARADRLPPHLRAEARPKAPGQTVPADLTQPPTGNGDHPNEPTGMTAITEQPYSALGTLGWSVGNSTQMTIETDNTAPESPSSVQQHEITSGQAAGVYGNHVSPLFSHNEVYWDEWLKVDADWHGHSSGTSPKVNIIKGDGTENHVLLIRGFDDGSLTVAFNAQGQQAADVVRCSTNNDLGNTCSTTFPRGQWNRVEVHLVGGTAGNQDGALHVWLNGTKVLERVNYGLITSGGANFTRVNSIMLWGGTGDSYPNATGYLRRDNQYISGK